MEIQTGSINASKFNNTAWGLHEGKGDRTYDHYIKFNKEYKKPPKVMVGFSYLDIYDGAVTRIKVRVKNVTKIGFQIEFFTWVDTHVYGAGANWLAYGD